MHTHKLFRLFNVLILLALVFAPLTAAVTTQASANDTDSTKNLAFSIKTRLAEELVGGTIEIDTTWTNDKTYIVTSNVGVAPGVTLTIQPGTGCMF